MEKMDYECSVKLSTTGMELQGLDPSRSSLFKFVLGKLGDDYEIFGMDLIDFTKILERVKSASEITLGYDSKACKIVLRTKINNKKKTFRLSEIDAEMAKIPFDVLMSKPYEAAFTMPTKDFVAILKDGEIYSNDMIIGIKDGLLSFKASSSIGSALTQLEDFPYHRDFAISYSIPLLLSKIDKMQSYDVTMVLGENKKESGLPIYLNYEFDDGYLKIFVAPKVEEDDY